MTLPLPPLQPDRHVSIRTRERPGGGGVAGVKLDGVYLLRVEYLQSGLLRVTRIDEAAAGVAWSVGQDSDVSAGPLTTMSGASAKAWVQVLFAQGTTFEITPSELDDFLVADALDHAERALPWPAMAGYGFVESIAHRVTVLHQGKVLAEGDMQSISANPKVKEVYLGH